MSKVLHVRPAGVSAYLMSQRCSRAELSRFLFTRGLWLVVLEVTLMSLVWTFNFRYDHGLFLQVIWAIGISMMVLAALVHLPLRAIAIFSLVVICGHNLLDGVDLQPFGAWAPLWSLLHVFGPIPDFLQVPQDWGFSLPVDWWLSYL